MQQMAAAHRCGYVVGLKAPRTKVDHVAAETLVRRMLAEYGRAQLFEWYQASTVGKVVFDVDGKEAGVSAEALLRAALAAVATFFGHMPDPDGIVIAASHGPGKLSFRIFVLGFRMRMSDIKRRIVRLGLDKDHPFDTAIYGATQKLRMVGSIKEPSDARVLKLIDAQHRDVEPTRERLLDTLVQVADPTWPLLTEDAPTAPPPKRPRRDAPAIAAPATAPATTSASTGAEEATVKLPSGYRVPSDQVAALRLLVDNGFRDPSFVGLPRADSLTFRADNRDSCPCCGHDHARHNWFATEDAQGVLLAKSYSTRCCMTAMRPVQQILDVAAGQEAIAARLALVERRQGQTELDVHVIRNTLVDFGPHIEAALNQEIAPTSVIMRTNGGGFAFNCSEDRHDYDCEILVNPTCRVSCSSDHTVTPIIAGWAGNSIIQTILNNPVGDTAYVEWFRLHEERQLGIQWRFDKDFFFTSGGTWTRVNAAKGGDIEFLEQRFLDLLKPRLAILDQIAHSNVLPDVDATERKRLRAGARKAHNHIQSIRATKLLVQAARVCFYQHRFADAMDRDRHLLGTPQGVLDLRHGHLLSGGHGFQVSMTTAADYHGLDLPTPDVERVFQTIFDGDVEMVRFFQLFLGSAITGEKTETYACFTGSGANGKSLTLDWIRAALGAQYYLQGDKSLFFGVPRNTGGATPYLADLLSRRLAVVQENDVQQDPLNIAELKRNTSTSPFTARRLYQDPFELDPTHTQILATNSLPKFDGTDYAIVRRCIVIPFRIQFKHGGEYDPTKPLHRQAELDLDKHLHTPECRSQLLTWMVRGAMDWYAAACPKLAAHTPKVMAEAKRAYVEENDPIEGFMADHCTRDPDGWICEAEFNSRAPHITGGIKPMLERKQLVRVRKSVDGKQKWGWRGLRWLEEGGR